MKMFLVLALFLFNCATAFSMDIDDGEQKNLRFRFPQEVIDVLYGWFDTHRDYPYPNQEEKDELMDRANIDSEQLTNWMTNARRRYRSDDEKASQVEKPKTIARGSRPRFPENAYRQLEALFAKNTYPSLDEQKTLAQENSLTDKQVIGWFKRERKRKKDLEKKELARLDSKASKCVSADVNNKKRPLPRPYDEREQKRQKREEGQQRICTRSMTEERAKEMPTIQTRNDEAPRKKRVRDNHVESVKTDRKHAPVEKSPDLIIYETSYDTDYSEHACFDTPMSEQINFDLDFTTDMWCEDR